MFLFMFVNMSTTFFIERVSVVSLPAVVERGSRSAELARRMALSSVSRACLMELVDLPMLLDLLVLLDLGGRGPGFDSTSPQQSKMSM
ncbi:hypothetical protein ACOMHN_057727 [Nucella lapillus]